MEINPFQTRSKLYRTPFKIDTSSSSHLDTSRDNGTAHDSSFLSAASSSASSASFRVTTPTSSELATLPTIPLGQPLEETPVEYQNFMNHRKNSQKRSRERTPMKSPEFSLSLSLLSSTDSFVGDKRFKPNSIPSDLSQRNPQEDASVGRCDSIWSLSGLSASLPHTGGDRSSSSSSSPSASASSAKSSRSSVASSIGTVVDDEASVDINTSFSAPSALNFGGLRAHVDSIESAYKEMYEQKLAAEAMVRKYQQRAKVAEDALKAQEQAANEAASVQVINKQKDKKIARLEYDLEHTRELHRAQRRIVDKQVDEITRLRNKVSELKLEIATTPRQQIAEPQRPPAQRTISAERNVSSAQPRSSLNVNNAKSNEDAEPKFSTKVAEKPKVVRVALKERDANQAQEFANRARQHREQMKEKVEKPKPELPAVSIVPQEAQPLEARKEEKPERRPRALPREIEDITQQENQGLVDEDGINWRELASSGKMNSLKVVQLDKYLRRHGLSKSGKKAVKIERITMHLCSTS